MKTKSREKKTVKGWAIIDTINNEIDCADYFVDNVCPAAEHTNANAVYDSLQTAKSNLSAGGENHKIVKCTITYEL